MYIHILKGSLMKKLLFVLMFANIASAKSDIPKATKHKSELTEEEIQTLVKHETFTQCYTSYSQVLHLQSLADQSEGIKKSLKKNIEILNSQDCNELISLVSALYKANKANVWYWGDSAAQIEEKLREYLKD
jgi:hypothetical protein